VLITIKPDGKQLARKLEWEQSKERLNWLTEGTFELEIKW
jgi:hypothetical protein